MARMRFGARCRRGLVYLAAGVPTTALGFAVALFAMIVGSLASVTLVGVFVVGPLVVLMRAGAWAERRRCAVVLPERVAPPYRGLDGLTGRARLRAYLVDPATWRDLTWLGLAMPINVGCVVVAGCLWTTGLGLVSLPVWYRYLPGGRAKLYDSGGVDHVVVDNVAAALPWALAGLVLLWLAAYATGWLAVGQARLAATLLGPTRDAQLRRRVATLSATRAAAVAGQQRELRRIERDLHDGAQARLVALSADLGLAGEAFDDDPAQARQLVDQARDGLLVALSELRDLVRGIGPPVLRDRGLAAALEAVTARSPIPVTIAVTMPRRPPAAVEAAAYFVFCEAVANAGKHSHATRLTVDVREEGGGCVVTVTDDGTGGADPRGPGLAGLADRVSVLDGQLHVDSPAGGPTTVRAVLPCGW